MGRYVNPGNRNFASVAHSGIYVDKTGMLEHLNQMMDTEMRWVCVSRPRRFGKTLAADMAAAYYSRGCSSDELFRGRKIASASSYRQFLNQCNVIQWDMAAAIQNYGGAMDALDGLKRDTVRELNREFPGTLPSILAEEPNRSLPLLIGDLNLEQGPEFIFIIDEWDAIYREGDDAAQEAYTRLLRGMFKAAESKRFIRLAYLTGILPIKRYNSESALNNFREYTMTDPRALAEYVGFTDEEVRALCGKRDMDYDRMRRMYDGYSFSDAGHVYCPNSVINAVIDRKYRCYWTQTSSYEIVRTYISMDYQGLKGDIVALLAGGRCKVRIYRFENDMKNVRSRDDVLTVLIHLGYLAYDEDNEEVRVPNEEVRSALEDVVSDVSWEPVIQAITASDQLLKALLREDADAVAAGVEEAHQNHASLWKYNDENTLACVIRLAFYNAINEYEIFSEMPTGVGRADLIFLPIKTSDKPALVVELKCDKSAESAIDQIKSRRYPASIERYAGRILIAGISYDRNDPEKKHSCVIEEWEKE